MSEAKQQTFQVVHGHTSHSAQRAVPRQQHRHNNQQQLARHAVQEEKEEEHGDDEWRGMKRGGREGREMRKGEMEMVLGKDSEQVDEDVMGWTVVTRNKKQKRRTVQIFAKVDDSKIFPLDVSPDDKVNDGTEQIQNDEGVHVTMCGRVVKRSEKLGQ